MKVQALPKRKGQVWMTIAIDSELKGLLKAEAAYGQMTMVEKLHEILCDSFDRPDIKDRLEEHRSIPA